MSRNQRLGKRTNGQVVAVPTVDRVRPAQVENMAANMAALGVCSEGHLTRANGSHLSVSESRLIVRQMKLLAEVAAAQVSGG